ncbi:hypothetical protein KSC_079750 [Ktedonobacter sp. SOSP1-52]|uniref:outer membrane protein assembly factor BamB family protein n=1 Tax=Ktedonobacter sp. SOSP1-52 TaxID=2778366 RepID=UPI001915A67F|nr:PQQ-binding-like beta-propeller repeat protein [Ktedonobacter sp. SOSP1-52]GHO69083.1 hypothetical protein KSC_079750 [Ktedonobacter sp. SOSP1-52]
MNNDDMTFMPERLDEQIEHPTNWLAPDDQRLVQDLRHTHQAYERENAQSLQRVWNRLEQERQEQRLQDAARTAPISLQQREQTMKDTSSSDSSSRGSNKRVLSLIAAVIVVAVLTGSAALIFSMAGKNNTAHNQSNTASVKPTSTPVVNSSGTYIMYQNEQYFYVVDKLDSKTHKSLWTYQNKKLADLGYPTVYGDTVYLNASDDLASQSHLIALNATTGKVRWDIPFKTLTTIDENGSGPFNMGYLTMPVVSDGQVFVANRAGTVFAFNSETGKQNWTYKIGASALVKQYYTDPNTGKKKLAGSTFYDGSVPQVSNGVLYGALEHTLYAVDIKSGKQVWSTKITSEEQVFGDAQVVDGIIYASSHSVSQHHDGQAYQSYVYAFNTKDGKQSWNYSIEGLNSSGLAIDNGHIYFIANQLSSTPDDSILYALNTQGKKVWKHNYSNLGVYWLTAGNGYVSVSGGTYDQGKVTSYTLYMLKANGQPAWQKDVVADPVSIIDGVLYTKSGLKIIAYDLTNQKELWQGQYGFDLVDKTGLHSAHLGYINVVP